VVRDPETVERVEHLAIPPAWREVWICPHPNGHLQAVGTDAAGRKQYLYHEKWRTRRDRAKFDRMLSFGAHLPELRRKWRKDVRSGELDQPTVMAAAALMLDLGLFRIGGERYLTENGSYGLATLQRDHARVRGVSEVSFDYRAKSGVRRREIVQDADVAKVIAGLKRRRDPSRKLFAYKADGAWVPLRSPSINHYLQQTSGDHISAKDFRTWHATVLMATYLAGAEPAGSERAIRHVLAQGYQTVSGALGNTPAVCRKSYVDPHVVDRYRDGRVIEVPATASSATALQARVEAAVLDLLSSG
jgi:DNA topoisomerase-1